MIDVVFVYSDQTEKGLAELGYNRYFAKIVGPNGRPSET
jgi:hypothetical protein